MTGTLNFDILLRDHIDGYRRLGWNGWCENLKPIVTNLKKLSPKNRASRGLKSIVSGYSPENVCIRLKRRRRLSLQLTVNWLSGWHQLVVITNRSTVTECMPLQYVILHRYLITEQPCCLVANCLARSGQNRLHLCYAGVSPQRTQTAGINYSSPLSLTELRPDRRLQTSLHVSTHVTDEWPLSVPISISSRLGMQQTPVSLSHGRPKNTGRRDSSSATGSCGGRMWRLISSWDSQSQRQN